jgi:protein-tyrosine sulfotransferase
METKTPTLGRTREMSTGITRYWTNWVTEMPDRELHAKRMLGKMGDGTIRHFSNAIANGELPLFKTPDSGNVEWLFHMFPNVRVILLIRDGRDTVTSYINSWGGQSIFRRLVKRWAARVHEVLALKEFVARNGIADRACLVRYEDLLEDAPSQLRRIFEFLDIPADEYPWDSLDYVPVLGSSSLKKNDEVHWKPVRKPDSFNPIGKWRTWSNHEKEIFKQYANELLISLGYAEDDTW